MVATGIPAQEGTTLSDWQFGEGTRHDWALAADGMYGGYAAISRRDDQLYQETKAGPRTYLRLPEHLIHSAFYLAEFTDALRKGQRTDQCRATHDRTAQTLQSKTRKTAPCATCFGPIITALPLSKRVSQRQTNQSMDFFNTIRMSWRLK
ncbi:hypothetical protein [Pseudaestuariivita rosea]|uniref:hypothetical protein n=1 Tax=Pseudaestuariivita rosea TaxID=2763263 RepID=UPI001ABB050B|nr:hypothetical protein [Pseudaestuariivita rosea]